MSNPFAWLGAYGITPGMMQAFVVLMVLAVVLGVLLDVAHKKSAKYFFEHTERMKKFATRQLSSSEKTSLLIQTILSEVLTSSEFHNPKRRIAHLLKMYGFVLFVISTVILIFFYPTTESSFWALLWRLGALMVMIGGYWFWFALRVDVMAEGHPWYRVVRADMFILSLLGTTTFGLLWSLTGSMVLFFLFILSAVILFGGVYWSKFGHMFFKPAAAYQKRVFMADGSREHLPPFYKRAEVLDQSTMDLVRDIPADQKFGLCIMKDEPKHY